MAKTVMTKEHKTALAEGRTQGRTVRAYLEALETNRPKRGRKRTVDSIRARLEAIEAEQKDANALQRLQLTQERLDLTAELEQTSKPPTAPTSPCKRVDGGDTLNRGS